jgi:hypothetical protein
MTLKRPKDKGTRFETWTENQALDHGLDAKREDAGNRWDITVRGSTGHTIEALVTRPNYGQAMATIRLHDFFHLLAAHGDSAHIECKRLAKVAVHSIFEDKFPQ